MAREFGEGAFSNNPALTSVDMSAVTGAVTFGTGVFANSPATPLVLAVTFDDAIVINGTQGSDFRTTNPEGIFPATATFDVRCFLEGTLILTPSGYKAIETLQKGDLIRTLKGDKPMTTLLSQSRYHDASVERNETQFFSLNYPSVFKPLIVTGWHSTLVTPTPKQFELIQSIFGVPEPVDGFYRLPAFVDEKASVYEVSGNYKVYNIVIGTTFEGIFANGLLVETCIIE